MDFENSKSAAQFPFPQPQNTFLVSNATPLIDFSLNMLATGRVGPTIRICVVTQPLNFPVFNRVQGKGSVEEGKHPSASTSSLVRCAAVFKHSIG